MTHYDDTAHGQIPTPTEDWEKLANTPQQTLKVKKLHPDAIIPKYATYGAACFDLHAIDCRNDSPVLPYAGTTFRTGLAFEVPSGHVMLVFSRSGHGFKHETRLANCVGVIDSDYRGELMVRLVREAGTEIDFLCVSPGDRIAQAMLVPIPRVALVEVKELSETERGTGGFGSTGV
jgi:dUTP pyrophosphatase